LRLASRLWPALALSLAPAAAAQTFDGTQGVDTYTGPVISPARITGLGGAFVGVAEGLDGAQANPAAVAQRARHLDRGWDWDWVLTWYVPDPRHVVTQDLGNDGEVDAGLTGLGNAQLGLSLQRGRLGVGVLARGWTVVAPRDAVGDVEVETAEASLAFGWSALRDSVVLGASVTGVSGVVSVLPTGAPPGAAPNARVEYSGSTLRFGALFRPRGRPFRLGASFHPEATARATGDRAGLPVTTPARFVFPWEASVGASAWIGPNARRYNEPPPFEARRHPEWGPEPAWDETRRRPVLVSAQLDVVGRSPGAVTVESVLDPSGGAVASGERVSVSVRAGAEWEPLPERLRARGGTYLEPSRTGGAPRLHGTFGVEGRLPFFWGYALKLGLAGDLAERFRNVSLSLGLWSSFAPRPPAPVP
jgi:hypothetical protein